MLPSFRLIAITFLGSFLLMFAGLRLVTSIAHDPLSALLANGAPAAITASDWRRADASMPVLFDMRFAAGTSDVASVPASLTLHAIDRATRAAADKAPDPLLGVLRSAPATDPADDGLAPPVARDGAETPAAAPIAVPDSVRSETSAESRIEVAALPEPTSPADPPANKERSAALTETDPPPRAVATAGTTEPATARPRRAKQKTARPTRQATQTRAARPRSTARRTSTSTAQSAPTNPFAALFGGAPQ